MEIFQGDFSELKKPLPLDVLTIGKFDGVHLGHQSLLKMGGKLLGPSGYFGVLIFRPSPWEFFSGKARPPIISSEAQISKLENFGVSHLFIQRFDEKIAHLSPRDFCKDFLSDLVQPKSIVVGDDFRFGHKGLGTIQDLQSHLGPQLMVKAMNPFFVNGERASSTKIREYLSSGDLQSFYQMMGKSYSGCFKVVKGHGIGRRLGFPTANLQGEDLYYPGSGVYCVQVQVQGETQKRLGVLNCGTRPTFSESKEVTLEVHLPDFSGNLYDQKIKLTWIQKIRDEKAFSGEAELIVQIKKDIESCKKISHHD